MTKKNVLYSAPRLIEPEGDASTDSFFSVAAAWRGNMVQPLNPAMTDSIVRRMMGSAHIVHDFIRTAVHFSEHARISRSVATKLKASTHGTP